MKKRNRLLTALGMIPKYQFELPSAGNEIRHSVTSSAADEAWPSRVTLIYNQKLLGVADSEFRRRGLYTSWSFIGCMIFITAFLFFGSMPFLFPLAPYWIIPFVGLVALPSAAAFLWLAKQELKGYAVYPVVFNRSTGKVYFFSIVNGKPVSYPWEKCVYCVVPKRSGGPEGSYYELRGYVLNDYDGVLDSFSIGEEAINPARRSKEFVERWFACHYEYIRMFMTSEDIGFLEPPNRGDYVSLKPSFKQSMNLVQPKAEPKSLVVKFLFAFIDIVIFVPKVVGGAGHYFCCKCCKVPQWSQEIIDECGPEIVLSNR
ncbi:DUF6708 domain-containing protein [Salinicola endophyticus]|uniref:DUF6708 domain-containing protein n=1 Tax=Salinicola endophyticus TaxID=1949083 RepID=A0AB74UF48_9GAMM